VNTRDMAGFAAVMSAIDELTQVKLRPS
jgi:hypothetical protein